MTRCDMRSLNECDCGHDHCAFQPKTLAAPVMVPSWKTQLAACLFGGFLIGAVVFVVAARAEPHFKTQDQINQEVATNGR